jgi:transposase-like protein
MTLVNHFRSEQSACLYLESHIWNDHVICPHCHEQWRIGRLDGFTTTKGTWKCYRCRKPFSARRNTFFEGSHIQLHVWLQGLYILAGTQFLIGAKRLGIILGISLRSAWQLKHKVQTLLCDDAQGMLPFPCGNDAIQNPEAEKPLDAPQDPIILRNPCGGTINTQFKCDAASATSERRFQRFLAAIDGFDIPLTDAAFEQIFPRLLSAPPHLPAKPKRASAPLSPAP